MSSVPCSHRVSSSVIDPPSLWFSWVVVHDSQSVVVVSNVFVPEQVSASSHSRSDLESLVAIDWEASVLNLVDV